MFWTHTIIPCIFIQYLLMRNVASLLLNGKFYKIILSGNFAIFVTITNSCQRTSHNKLENDISVKSCSLCIDKFVYNLKIEGCSELF